MINGSISEGLTFDDVLLLPGKSAVLPADTDTRTCGPSIRITWPSSRLTLPMNSAAKRVAGAS